MKQNIKKVLLGVMYGSLLFCPYRLLRQQRRNQSWFRRQLSLQMKTGAENYSEGVWTAMTMKRWQRH